MKRQKKKGSEVKERVRGVRGKASEGRRRREKGFRGEVVEQTKGDMDGVKRQERKGRGS